MSIGNKIKALRTDRDLTQMDITKICGVTDGAVSTWERGVAYPRMDALQKLSDYFGIKISDLIEDDISLQPVNLSDTISIPVYCRIPAGASRHSEEYIDERIQVPRSWTTIGQELAAMRVVGESMLPLIQDGDLVVYQYQPDVESGSIGICRIDGDDATVTKIIKQRPHTIILQPLNASFQPIIFTGEAMEPSLEIIGKVIEVRHRL